METSWQWGDSLDAEDAESDPRLLGDVVNLGRT